MAMSEIGILVLCGGAGILLGVFFFGGLWWTVRRGLAAKRPALWFLGSLLLRTGIVLAGIYLVSGGRWDGLLACLAGFVIARFLVTRHASLPAGHPHSPVKEPAHAP
jgi:F1F0 ATPase subunit 2